MKRGISGITCSTLNPNFGTLYQRLDYNLYTVEVAGSNPARPTSKYFRSKNVVNCSNNTSADSVNRRNN